ncbi:MAG: MFS transporter, partial [Propionibacteriaceae bacterium]|nr:MFS transporter [Propionibacteriaceae bacterium]
MIEELRTTTTDTTTQPAASGPNSPDRPDDSRQFHSDTPAPGQTPVDGGSGAPPALVLPQLTHRQILSVLSGLLVAMFVSNVAGTIVGNALPVITAKLGSSEAEYMWIVTATLLASTASTPIWGKLADLFDKKRLIMIGLAVFAVGSVLAGASVGTNMLIATRAVQGIGLGAIMSLTQAIMGTVIPPRARGRYMAYTGAVTAVATVVAPLVGGFLVDQEQLGWRWCFWSAVPFSLLSILILRKQLHVPHLNRPGAKVDWLGASIITASTSALLIWISFVEQQFAWLSWQTVAFLAGTALGVVVFIVVESKVHDPIIPLGIVSMRVTALAIVASVAVGLGLFGSSVFLAQYFQLARGESPTASGLLMTPMMAGVLLSSLVIGRLVSRFGLWKPFVVAGSVILTAGFGLLSQVGEDTGYVRLSLYMGLTGLGLGMTMQNLVLAVQNSISVRDVGAATGAVTFFRSLGGAIGIQVLGFVFQKGMISRVQDGLPGLLQAAVGQDSWARPAAAGVCQAVIDGGAGGVGGVDPAALAALSEQCPNTAQVLQGIATLEAAGGSTMDVAGLNPQVAHLVQSSIGRSV